MIGGNTLTLNQATVIAALDHYFKTVLFAEGKAPEVKSIKQQYGGGYVTEGMFEIGISSPMPNKATQGD